MRRACLFLIGFLIFLGPVSQGFPLDKASPVHSVRHGSQDLSGQEGEGNVDSQVHGQMENHNHKAATGSDQEDNASLAARVRVEEQLGAYIDFTARFVDEKNRPVNLKTIFDKPVVLLPIFFMCTSVCNILQAQLAKVLNQTDDIPGKDFNVVSLSFSDDEGPLDARGAKANYTHLVKREFVPENWYHLTGDRENILKLTNSLGYYFVKRQRHVYIHPNVLMVLARDGKIIRYIYGPDFLPFDVGMALGEARKGEPGLSIKRGVLSFCFEYDPQNKTYVFKLFRITGTAILLVLAGFVIFLIYPSLKQGKSRQGWKGGEDRKV